MTRSARTAFFASLVFLLWAAFGARELSIRALRNPAAAAASADTTPRVAESPVDVAGKVLAILDDVQKSKAFFDVDAPERTNWHFIPRGRRGIPLNELAPAHQDVVLGLLRASMSAAGFERTQQIRGLEAILAEREGKNRRFPRDPTLYFVSFFGKPSRTDRWGWRFEGHHLSLNFSLHGDRLVAATPYAMGANPSIVVGGPHDGLRVLGSMEDLARELVQSLDADQRKVAVGGEPEEVGGTEEARAPSTLPPGLTADRLNEKQRETLRRLIDEYTLGFPDELRKSFTDETYASGLAAIQFLWRGGTKAGEGHSYMIHGPALLLSYANFQNDAKHVHAGLRTRAKDFDPPTK
jgi:hypothetical protein